MFLIVVSFLGLVFGSFINAWVWRVHQQINSDGEPRKLSKKRTAEVSILKGRSRCPICNHVLSWLSIGGKCRYCKEPISLQYPFIELVTALLFVISYYSWSFNFTWQVVAFATWLVGLIGLVGLAVYDAKWMLLPDRMLKPLYWLVGMGLGIQFILGRPLSDVLYILSAVAISSGLFWLLYQVSEGKWIGGGDVKLGILTGMLMGNALIALLSIFIASILGTIAVAPSLITKKTTLVSKIPFGPFLIAGCIVAVLCGQNIIDWYLSLIGV
jgi:leader peptidase (prepilin peptidase)/N-methyltransferase